MGDAVVLECIVKVEFMAELLYSTALNCKGVPNKMSS